MPNRYLNTWRPRGPAKVVLGQSASVAAQETEVVFRNKGGAHSVLVLFRLANREQDAFTEYRII